MNQIRELAKKFIAGEASLAEKEFLHNWYDEQVMTDEQPIVVSNATDAEDLGQRIYQAIIDRLDDQETSSATLIKREVNISWRVAAAVLVLVTLSITCCLYWFENAPKKVIDAPKRVVVEDAPPGGNKATLKLAQGQKIELSNRNVGLIAQTQGVAISKTTDGLIVYRIVDREMFRDPIYHELTTPKSGQYQVILPDCTKVWLNSASTLKYPTRFASDRREIELEGEAYFEVADVFSAVRSPSQQNKGTLHKVPFIVKTKNQIVEVTGTKFNINAYADESAERTTLIEGGVRVTVSSPIGTHQSKTTALKPGEQAVLSNNRMDVAKVDVENALSWKEGNFLFNDQPLHVIMRQLARWYDVEVAYTNMPNGRYNGFISKDVPLSNVLEMFEKTGDVRFELRNRTINVKH